MKKVMLFIAAAMSLMVMILSCNKVEDENVQKEYWQVVTESIKAIDQETESAFNAEIDSLNARSENYDVEAAVGLVEEIVEIYDGLVAGTIILQSSYNKENWRVYNTWTLEIPGPDYVDLALSSGVKWAVYNIGARSPEEIGDYFAWGEISPKSEYTQANYLYYGLEISDISGNPSYDAATAILGSEWRMPTQADFEALMNECTWEWFDNDGYGYFVVTGANGNQITLPTPGYFVDSAATGVGIAGMYWTSNCVIDATGDKAVNVFLRSLYQVVNQQDRSLGMNIRAVRD